MTEVLAPPVSEVLTAETVKLLVKGDLLRVVEPGFAFEQDEIVSFTAPSVHGNGYIDIVDSSTGYFVDRFAFVGRPSLAAPTVQEGGQDDCLLPPQEASVPVAADGEVAPQSDAAWSKYRNDFEAMSDAAIDHETGRAQDLIDENEAWTEAVAAWVEAGRPRNSKDQD